MNRKVKTFCLHSVHESEKQWEKRIKGIRLLSGRKIFEISGFWYPENWYPVATLPMTTRIALFATYVFMQTSISKV